LYGYANPIIYTDPTGNVPYDRDAAVSYALQFATHSNSFYKEFGESDCTSFVSQALKAGGFPEDDNWFFEYSAVIKANKCSGYRLSLITNGCSQSSNPEQMKAQAFASLYQSSCGNSWALTDNLYTYLTVQKGFTITKIRNMPESPDWVQFPSSIKKGDVVFYHQNSADYFENLPDGLFNHAAFIVGWGLVTKLGVPINSYPLSLFPDSGPSKPIPHVADHSGKYSYLGPRSINDTASKVDELVVVHIPDDIPVNNDKPHNGCNR